MLPSITLFSIHSDDIGFLVLCKGICLGKGNCFLNPSRGIGLDTLDLGIGIGILNLCGSVSRSFNCFLDIFL